MNLELRKGKKRKVPNDSIFHFYCNYSVIFIHSPLSGIVNKASTFTGPGQF